MNTSADPGGQQDKPASTTRSASFEILCRHYLSAEGDLADDAPALAHDKDLVCGLYRHMALARAFDAKAVAMQRTGRIGTYASLLGEEAVGCAVARAMRDSDVLLPSFREHGAQLQRGVPIESLLLYWAGDERGNHFEQPKQDFPNCVPIASQVPIAAGVALGIKLRGGDDVAVTIVGDGATSKGDFYEGLNIAGAWQLPVLTIVINNGWAISMPRRSQTHARTLAQKAIAAGMPGEQVDGNDVLAVLQVCQEAIARIRDGHGPQLVEALTYRLADHTTADDAGRYRPDDEVSGYWPREPLARLRTFIGNQGWWSKDDEQRMTTANTEQIEAAVTRFEQTAPQPVTSIFDSLFAQLPPALQRQRDQAVAAAEQPGD